MAQSENADEDLGFELNPGQIQVPQKNVSATPIEFLTSTFLSIQEFNVADLFYAGNIASLKNEVAPSA